MSNKRILKTIWKRMVNEKSISEFYIHYLKKSVNDIYEVILYLIQKINEKHFFETWKNITENEILKNIEESSITFLLDDILNIYSFDKSTYEETYNKLWFKTVKDTELVNKWIINLNPEIFNSKTIDSFFMLFNMMYWKHIEIEEYKIPFKKKKDWETEIKILDNKDIIYTYNKIFYLISLYNFFIDNKSLFISEDLRQRKQKQIDEEIKIIEEQMKKEQKIPDKKIYNRNADKELTFKEIIEYYINLKDNIEKLEEENKQINNPKDIQYIKNKEKIYKHQSYLDNIKDIFEKWKYDIEILEKIFKLMLKKWIHFNDIHTDFVQISKTIILLKYVNNIVDINMFFIILTYMYKNKDLKKETVDILKIFISNKEKCISPFFENIENNLKIEEKYNNINKFLKELQLNQKEEKIEVKIEKTEWGEEEIKVIQEHKKKHKHKKENKDIEKEADKKIQFNDFINTLNKYKDEIIDYILNKENNLIWKEILNQYVLYYIKQKWFDINNISEFNYTHFIDLIKIIYNNFNYIKTDTFKEYNDYLIQNNKNLFSIWYNIISKSKNLDAKNLQYFIEFILPRISELNNSELSILYIFYLFTINENTDIVHTNDFSLFVYEDYCFILSDRINLKMLTSLEIFLTENKEYRKKKHIFVIWLYEFILSYKEKYLNNFSMPWNTSHYFKELIKYMYYKWTKVSEISITWYYTRQVWYVLIRENDAYRVVEWENNNSYSELLPFSVISNFIKDIMTQWWQVQDEILSDTEFEISWVMYRVAVIKDWDLIHIQIRRWDKPWIDPDYKSEYFRLWTHPIENRESEISLYDSYKKDDVEMLIRYAIQTKWLMIFSAPTGSWKSVSQRNLMDAVVKEKINKEKVFTKVIEITDTIEYRDLNITQVKMDMAEQNSYWARALKRAKPDYIVFSEIRDADFMRTALDLSKTWWVMTTMHAFDILETLQQLKSWWDMIWMSMVEIINSIKIIISQILYPQVKSDILDNKKELLKEYYLWTNKKDKEEKNRYLIWYKNEFISAIESKWASNEKANEIWEKFYNTILEKEILGVVPKDLTRPKLAYEIATKTTAQTMLWKELELKNLDYFKAVKLYNPKEETIIKSILDKKSPITAIDLCSMWVLPFVIEKMYNNWELQ